MGCLPPEEVTYRQAMPDDLEGLQALHHQMFPLDYEAAFFERVVNHYDGLQSLAAFNRDHEGNEAIIGFVTARPFKLWECDPVDRAFLGLDNRLLDHESLFYILTLAVSPHFRKKGIGSRLVRWVVQQAQKAQCRAAFLHVIEYNKAAIALYSAQGFQEIACRENFYYITSGRQPDPKKETYDAFLFAFLLASNVELGLLSYFMLAVTPLRVFFGHLQTCLPWKAPPDSYFGGGDGFTENARRSSLKGSTGSAKDDMPSWLVSLFLRRKLLRQQ